MNKFNPNDRVWITPDDTDLWAFSARVESFDAETGLYVVKDKEDNTFNFFGHEMELEN